MQSVHQGNLMFLTLYVFDQNRNGTWFNALVTATTPGGPQFTGDLFQASGPYYGGVFAPPATNRVVGTATFTATSATRATLTYTVEGVTVNKTVERYPLTSYNLSGNYIGSFLSVNQSCANPANNGRLFNGSGQFTVVHTVATQAVTITAVLSDNLVAFTCNYQGTYSQLGRIGAITGTYQCTSGQSGTWNANEIEVSTLGGLLGRYTATNAPLGCSITGGFGGLKPN
jgi:hypothetical protein